MNQHTPFRFVVESWLQWNIVTGLSLVLALAVLPAIANIVHLALTWEASLLVSAVFGGAIVGLAQWLLLHLDVKGVGRWALVSSIGCAGTRAHGARLAVWPAELTRAASILKR